MEEFRNYDILFPELVYDIVNYFRIGNGVKELVKKSVLDYCINSRFNALAPDNLIQPDTVHRICEILTQKRVMNCIRVGTGSDGCDSNYLFSPAKEELFLQKHPATIYRLNCLVYGFSYIYSTYKDHVLPVVVRKNEEITMGTCFRFHSGILTARHCLEVDEVFIPGIVLEQLRSSTVVVSEKEDIDIAYIELNQPQSLLVAGDAHVLDEVLVMGYPKIPQFFEFCAAERATISSIPTRGAVASLADQYLSKSAGQLMLVTARIRGGNSGGPIIDSNGAVVGVAFSEPSAEGDYDEMGYGVAYPIEVFYQMLNNPLTMEVNFVDAIN